MIQLVLCDCVSILCWIELFEIKFFFTEREQSVADLKTEVSKANVICVVYSVEEEDTLDRVISHWLPLIRSVLGEQHQTPVILVGNKVDLVDYSTMEVNFWFNFILIIIFISTTSHKPKYCVSIEMC